MIADKAPSVAASAPGTIPPHGVGEPTVGAGGGWGYLHLHDLIPPGSEPISGSSDVDVAGRVISDLQTTGPVVSTRGEIYRYHDQRGTWAPMSQDVLAGYISLYNGALLDGGKTLSLSWQRVCGIRSALMRDLAICKEDFFDAAPKGASVGGDFITIEKGEPVWGVASQDHRALWSVPAFVVPGTKFDDWFLWVREFFLDDDDHERKIRFLQEFVGACLFGVAPEYERCALFVGAGANGKSVLLDAIRSIFPREATSSVSPKGWSREYNVAQLTSSAINFCGELPSKHILEADAVKTVISGEDITARHPYGRPFTFRPRCGHIFAANELPTSVDHSDGFYRRFVVLEFNRSFAGGGKSRAALRYEILRLQDQIVAWAIAGAARLIGRGEYTIPASSAEMVSEWRETNDSVLAWVRGPGARYLEEWCSASSLYRSYADFCDEAGLKAVSQTRLGTRLKGTPGVEHRRSKHGMRYKVTEG